MSEPTAGYNVERAETAPAPATPATPALLQQRFLTALLGQPIRLFTTRGVRLTGTWVAHDPYTIQRDFSVIFKSAVVSIQPARDTGHTPTPGERREETPHD